MTNIIIPDAVEEAAAKANYEARCAFYRLGAHFAKWEELSETDRANEIAWNRAALRAGLAAWPGMFPTEMEEAAGVRRRLILPLPQEKQP